MSLAHPTGWPSDFGGFPPFAARAVPVLSAYATKMHGSLVPAKKCLILSVVEADRDEQRGKIGCNVQHTKHQFK
jgi:hypothetical protein